MNEPLDHVHGMAQNFCKPTENGPELFFRGRESLEFRMWAEVPTRGSTPASEKIARGERYEGIGQL